MFKRILGLFSGSPKGNGRKTLSRNIVGNRRRLHHERLEDRCMLATLSVNLNSDGAVPTDDGNLSLREAVAYVNGTAFVGTLDAQRISGTLGQNDVIQIASNVTGIALTQGALGVGRPVVINGNNANISAVGVVFNVNAVGGPAGTVQISNFNMQSSDIGVQISSLGGAQSALVSSNTFSSNNYGINIADGLFSQLQINGNTFSGNGRGVYLDGSSFSSNPGTLGVPISLSGNTFQNSLYSGVYVANISSASSTLVVSNNIFGNNGGTDPTNEAAIRLLFANVPFQIDHNTIGKTSPTVGAGNSQGIRIQGATTSGNSVISLNVIGGNTYDGIFIGNSSIANLAIVDNAIGIDATLTYALPNGSAGISLASANIKEIGEAQHGNFIVANVGNGIQLSSNSSGADIAYNQILLNGGAGIMLGTGASGFEIDLNSISSNTGAGIRLASSAGIGNSFLRNSFSSNTGLAIDLETSSGSGVTPNDPEDVDSGPNNLLNYPELVTSSVDTSGNWTVFYDIDVDKQGTYWVDLYRYNASTKTYTPLVDSSNPPNYTAVLISATTAAQPGRQRFQTVITPNFGLSAGDVIVATLTGITGDNTGNTSEFSTPITLVNGPPRVVDVILDSVASNGTPNWSRDPYSYAGIVPTGKQLAPINTAGVNTIKIKFSEHVRQPNGGTLSGSELKLYAARKTGNLSDPHEPLLITETDFSYNSATFEATWTFPTLTASKYRIDVSALGIRDVSGTLLDGEWTNETAGTHDVFGDDPLNRVFVSGNGIGGSTLDLFRFFFSLLPGDGNQDGVVNSSDTSGTIADVDGDGDGDSADVALVNSTYMNTFLPAPQFRGDFNDDENVDGVDYIVWRSQFDMSGSGLSADANGDGHVNASDYTLWSAGRYTWGAWYVGPHGTAGAAEFVDFENAPAVTNVTISGSNSLHDPYSFDAHDGSGEQLKTVPVGGADTISITFSEDVNVVAENLRVVGLRTFRVPTVVEFSYDIGTMTATWRFDDLIANDHYLISLSDAVTDIEGNRLDGEWVNPVSITTTNSLVSVFPSGDGNAGGHFNFVITLLASDFNHDNYTEYTDYQIWSSNEIIIYVGATHADGDGDGDGDVDEDDDYYIITQFYDIDLTNVEIFADLDGDFDVDDDDLAIFDDNLGMSNPTRADGDLDGDGDVDADDLDLMFAQYGLQLAVVS